LTSALDGLSTWMCPFEEHRQGH